MTDEFCKEKIEKFKIKIITTIQTFTQNISNIVFEIFKR